MSRGCFRQMVNASHLAAVAVAVPGSVTRLRPIIKPSDDSSRPRPDRTLVAIAAPDSVRPTGSAAKPLSIRSDRNKFSHSEVIRIPKLLSVEFTRCIYTGERKAPYFPSVCLAFTS